MKLSTTLVATLAALVSTATLAQSAPPDLAGTWRAETPDGPQTVIVRPDSSASFGDEIVRWRIVADSIFLAISDEWYVYNFVLAGETLTLSGGDLVDPMDLERTGPPTPRPEGVAVPLAPPMSRRADMTGI